MHERHEYICIWCSRDDVVVDEPIRIWKHLLFRVASLRVCCAGVLVVLVLAVLAARTRVRQQTGVNVCRCARRVFECSAALSPLPCLNGVFVCFVYARPIWVAGVTWKVRSSST